jgi:hypothetical protein
MAATTSASRGHLAKVDLRRTKVFIGRWQWNLVDAMDHQGCLLELKGVGRGGRCEEGREAER